MKTEPEKEGPKQIEGTVAGSWGQMDPTEELLLLGDGEVPCWQDIWPDAEPYPEWDGTGELSGKKVDS